MTVKEYFAAAGSKFTDADAQVIGPELQRLAAEGKATTSGIVEAARDRRSPLHPYFEWDDQVAADAYRKLQAREMVQSIRVRMVDGEGERETLAVRAVTVRTEPAPASERQSWYRPATPAERIRNELRRELRRIVDRFGRYPSLVPELGEEFGPMLELLNRAADGLPIEAPKQEPPGNPNAGVRVIQSESGRWWLEARLAVPSQQAGLQLARKVYDLAACQAPALAVVGG